MAKLSRVIPRKINLGCGKDIKEGYLNVDFEVGKGVDLKLDLNNLPYPFRKNQFEEVYMRNILEHLTDPYNVMKEIHRICAPRALIMIRVPHFSSNNVWGDLQHKRGFNTDTFKNENMSSMFEIIDQKITFSSIRLFIKHIARISPTFYEKHLAYVFPAIDIVINLRVLK
jgi:predicted SAM-dependent methyltransferase